MLQRRVPVLHAVEIVQPYPATGAVTARVHPRGAAAQRLVASRRGLGRGRGLRRLGLRRLGLRGLGLRRLGLGLGRR